MSDTASLLRECGQWRIALSDQTRFRSSRFRLDDGGAIRRSRASGGPLGARRQRGASPTGARSSCTFRDERALGRTPHVFVLLEERQVPRATEILDGWSRVIITSSLRTRRGTRPCDVRQFTVYRKAT